MVQSMIRVKGEVRLTIRRGRGVNLAKRGG